MDLISFAYENGLQATKLLSRDEQKQLGQFMTPSALAKAMAARTCVGLDQPIIRILEPARLAEESGCCGSCERE